MTIADARPWYQRVFRWGQTNLTEIDPIRYDAEWWRQHWRKTRVQGIIVNAGGIVFYYPSRFTDVHFAKYLGQRDLFGEIVQLAREEGLAVLARMDSNRVHEPFYLRHPDWCAVDSNGVPYRSGEMYMTCVNSPYYSQFIPEVMTEIIERYEPEGLTDNSYSGLGRDHICYCHYCRTLFFDETGHDLPQRKNWSDPVYKQWLKWSYANRVRNWDINQRTVEAVGGKNCLWIGMNSGDVRSQAVRLRDCKAIFQRCKIVMADHQSRSMIPGFRQNGDAGKLIHSAAGWDVLIPESMAMYQHGHGQPNFRVASKPVPEVRLWAAEGFAGGIQPWWHHIGAYHEDRRQYKTAEPLFVWHEANEDVLVDRRPVANVGVVWNQDNTDFYGQDEAFGRVDMPYLGNTQALTRARIPYVPVHVDRIGIDTEDIDLLVLPNVAALSQGQCETIAAFVDQGGSLLASGETSLYDEWGNRRRDFALGDVLGVRARHAAHGSKSLEDVGWAEWDKHSYLRLHPEHRRHVYGPQLGSEPEGTEERHRVLQGFEETDILLFGGELQLVDVIGDAAIPLTLIPRFPIYPPETSYMEHTDTDLPAAVLQRRDHGAKVAYLAADVDRLYGKDNHPDHQRLLENILRWALDDAVPLVVEGPGYIDCHLYEQPGRRILHLVNLTNTEAWRGAVHELTAVGPITVKLPVGDGKAATVSLRVAGEEISSEVEDGWIVFKIASILDHEVAVISD